MIISDADVEESGAGGGDRGALKIGIGHPVTMGWYWKGKFLSLSLLKVALLRRGVVQRRYWAGMLEDTLSKMWKCARPICFW